MKQQIKRILSNILKKQGYQLTKIERNDHAAYAGYSKSSLKEARFYNVGAGNFYHPYWTNIDYATEHYAQHQRHPFINHNLMELSDFPLPDNCAQAVYSSHMIEHINDQAVAKFLTESYRILTQGGVIRLTAPDAALDWRAYHTNDIEFWYWRHEPFFNNPDFFPFPMKDASIEQLLILHLFSQLSPLCKDTSAESHYPDDKARDILCNMPMEQAYDYFAQQCRFNKQYPGNHINWWTATKAERFLRQAGFSNIYLSAYGQSTCPPMRNIQFFDNTMPKISFYIEAVKE